MPEKAPSDAEDSARPSGSLPSARRGLPTHAEAVAATRRMRQEAVAAREQGQLLVEQGYCIDAFVVTEPEDEENYFVGRPNGGLPDGSVERIPVRSDQNGAGRVGTEP